LKILGGNADKCENKGVAKKGIQKLMKIRELKIDGFGGVLRVAEERRDETGTLSAEPWVENYRMLHYLSNDKLTVVN
jgi:hypothetical protein